MLKLIHTLKKEEVDFDKDFLKKVLLVKLISFGTAKTHLSWKQEVFILILRQWMDGFQI